MSTITRFAPSPTGWLHLGHVYAALFARDRAHEAGGRFLLRLEDIDVARCRPHFAAALLEDMTWLGLAWDGPVRWQSDHAAEYAAVLAALRQRGLVYPCFCSRADIARASTAPHGPEGAIYPGTCRRVPAAEAERRVAAGAPHAWRRDVGRALHETGPLSFAELGRGRRPCYPAPFGDIVLGRRDAPASYHLAVAHDDAVQGVTLVTRGEDLRPAVAIHRLLQALMAWPEPCYAHHQLLADAAGRRLAKRYGALAVRALREAGQAAAEVLAMAAAAPLCNAPCAN